MYIRGLHIALPIQQETSLKLKIIVKNLFMNLSNTHYLSSTAFLNFTKILKGTLKETVPCYLIFLQWGVDHQMEYIVLLLALTFVMSTVVIFSLLRVMRPPLIDTFGDFGCQFQLRFFCPLFSTRLPNRYLYLVLELLVFVHFKFDLVKSSNPSYNVI